LLVDIVLDDEDEEEVDVDVDDDDDDECVMGLDDVDWMKCTSDANKQLLVM
jgi:hypothetical protein